MADKSRMSGDYSFPGNVNFTGQVSLPTGAIGDDAIQTNAAIAATKVEQQRNLTYAQPSDTAVVAQTMPLFALFGATGELEEFEAAVITPASNAGGDNRTVTVDLHKNGATMLSAPIVLDKTNVARTFEAAAIASADLVSGDVLEVVVTVGGTTGTQASGLIVRAKLTEAAL